MVKEKGHEWKGTEWEWIEYKHESPVQTMLRFVIKRMNEASLTKQIYEWRTYRSRGGKAEEVMFGWCDISE